MGLKPFSNILDHHKFSLLLCIAFILFGAGLKAQTPQQEKQNRLEIINADEFIFEDRDGEPVRKLLGNVFLRQDSTDMLCDSAYHYVDSNYVIAYSNVRIYLSRSISIRADRLTYDGNTKIARLFDNIILRDSSVTLLTNRLVYYRIPDYGNYFGGGVIETGDNELSSVDGFYYPKQDLANFYNDVVLNNPDYTLETDTLGYQTEKEIAYFMAPTRIFDKVNKIYTEQGYYDTKKDFAYLYQNASVGDTTYTLYADTIQYDQANDFGIAQKDVVVIQADSGLKVMGQYAEFWSKKEESFITDSAYAIQKFEQDTLYLFADTLYVKKDTASSLLNNDISETPDPEDELDADLLEEEMREDAIMREELEKKKKASQDTTPSAETIQNKAKPDSLKSKIIPAGKDSTITSTQDSLFYVPKDSLNKEIKEAQKEADKEKANSRKVFLAYNNVRFFMKDLQGKNDSLVYHYSDSTIYFFKDPVLWSEETQITGARIMIRLRDGQLDSLHINKSAFIISQEDTIGFNQIKGKELQANFKNNDLNEMWIVGNSESIYFAKEEEKNRYLGMNKAKCNSMYLQFKENKPTSIRFEDNPEGTLSPIWMVLFEKNELDGFQWRIDERPSKPEGIFKADTLSDSSQKKLVDTLTTSAIDSLRNQSIDSTGKNDSLAVSDSASSNSSRLNKNQTNNDDDDQDDETEDGSIVENKLPDNDGMKDDNAPDPDDSTYLPIEYNRELIIVPK